MKIPVNIVGDICQKIRKQYYAAPETEDFQLPSDRVVAQWQTIQAEIHKHIQYVQPTVISKYIFPHSLNSLIQPLQSCSELLIPTLQRKWRAARPSLPIETIKNLQAETLPTIIKKNKDSLEGLKIALKTFVESKLNDGSCKFKETDHNTTSLCMIISSTEPEWNNKVKRFHKEDCPYKTMLHAEYDVSEECGLDIYEAQNGVGIHNISLFNIHRVSDLLAHLFEIPR